MVAGRAAFVRLTVAFVEAGAAAHRVLREREGCRWSRSTGNCVVLTILVPSC